MTIEYAPPAIEVIGGVISDKSQDADWLRARFFEQSAEIERLTATVEEGACRFDCRTAKENWVEGYRAAAGRQMTFANEAEEMYDEWKRRQAQTKLERKLSG